MHLISQLASRDFPGLLPPVILTLAVFARARQCRRRADG